MRRAINDMTRLHMAIHVSIVMASPPFSKGANHSRVIILSVIYDFYNQKMTPEEGARNSPESIRGLLCQCVLPLHYFLRFLFFHNWSTLPTIFFSVIVKLVYPFTETFSLWLYQWWVGRRGAFAAYPLQGMGRCFCLSFLLLFSDNCSMSNGDSPFDTLLTGC